jgi:hypothetical protein
MFAGATLTPWQDIRIEARNPVWPPGHWEEINTEFVHTEIESEAYTDPNGKWYPWPSVRRNGYFGGYSGRPTIQNDLPTSS